VFGSATARFDNESRHDGQVDASFQNVNTVFQHIKAGKLRPLAVTGAKRSPVLPDVPTIAEADGPKGVDVYSWQAIAAPKGLPADIRAKFHAAVIAALNEPQIKEQFTSVGLEIVGNTPEQFAAFQQREFARWKQLIETRKITAD
jgi:tripartite-type tricarboxylate transporter receptor subunit TctC